MTTPRSALVQAAINSEKPQTRAEANALAPAQPNRWIPSPAARQWLYNVLAALSPVGVSYGLITIEQGGLWLTLASAVLGVSNLLAGRNVAR